MDMDYEQKYKDAMARCELIARTGLKFVPGYIFPELAESEDERIRKELWEHFHDLQLSSDCDFSPSFTFDDILAYLEKQKESLHITETCKENTEFFTNEQVQPEVDLEHIENDAELIANEIMIGVQANRYHTCVYNTERNDFNHSHLVQAARKGIELGLQAKEESK